MNRKKTTLLASIGAGLEYYDFIIYGLLANYLSQAFFPSTNSTTAIIQTFSIFALGYLARPLGGFIFGHLGDRYSRKNIFLISLFIMAIATICIGLLPTYAQWGIAAPSLLIVLRILQGLAFGIELPSTITFVAEHACQTKRGTHTSMVLSSVSVGATLGAVTIFALTKMLTTEELGAWGWRIPFLFGGCLGIFSYFIRRQLTETPYFINSQPHAFPFYKLIKQNYKQLFLGIGISLFTGCFIIFGVGLPSYLQRLNHYPNDYIYLMMSLGLIWAAVVLPLFGKLSDYLGRKKLLMAAAGSITFCSILLFSLLNLKSLIALAIFMIIYQTIISALASCYLSILVEFFPTSVRLSGVAFCYNTVYAIAGFTPALLNKWLSNSSNPNFSTALFFMLLASTTLLFGLFIKDQPQQALKK